MVEADTARGPAATDRPAPRKHTLPPPPGSPNQDGPLGVRFDFNDGCRVRLPDGAWRLRFSDIETGDVLYDAKLGAGQVKSPKLYYQPYRIEVWKDDVAVFQHDFDAAGREVLIHIGGGVLGDTIGWFPYAAKFQEKHGCRLSCAMADFLIPLFRDAYPEIEFIPHEAVDRERYYATYHLGVSFKDEAHVLLPCDFRLVGAHRAMGYALGVDPAEQRPKIVLADDSRPIEEPYVCIAVQSTLQCKYWNRPGGWRELVLSLKAAGYRVVCIDQRREYGPREINNRIPEGCEDRTGDRPLVERARWLKHADFFVGLPSGLSWLAWAMEIPVVMISGFSHPVSEFTTPYRVINFNVCNSCWNDPRVEFDNKNFLWCPRHAGTPRQFECSRQISPGAVMAAIRTIPGFGQTEGVSAD